MTHVVTVRVTVEADIQLKGEQALRPVREMIHDIGGPPVTGGRRHLAAAIEGALNCSRLQVLELDRGLTRILVDDDNETGCVTFGIWGVDPERKYARAYLIAQGRNDRQAARAARRQQLPAAVTEAAATPVGLYLVDLDTGHIEMLERRATDETRWQRYRRQLTAVFSRS
ncbi:MAG: hypothetical protein J0H98_07160 [Solirubrobacterales bacterium]|nr:hypothetical protein [Solirubrobacterales bacterium]